jgi:Ser/Thr protein kinase RdoA (MazF antagonist)
MNDPNDPQAAVRQVIRDFALGESFYLKELGGTATSKFEVRTPSGHFVVRRRPTQFAGADMIRFDHDSLGRLAEAGLPVPRPLARPDGSTWVDAAGGRYEVLSWVEGGEFHEKDRQSVANVGRFLARFHAALREDIPPGKEGFLREDHPDLLADDVPQIRRLCETDGQHRGIEFLAHQIELVRENLDRRLWPRLPKAVTHGDVHPGNLKFNNSDVSAIFDFDYLSPQARSHDVVDALAFFASRRGSALDTDDIRSLVQPFRPDAELSRILLGGYEEISRLEDVEWEALPWIIRSLWIQMRLRGSRKVPTEQKAAFVLDRFEEVIGWLDREAADFFASLAKP